MAHEQKFEGTYWDVKRKVAEWKAAHPRHRIVRESAPIAMDDKALLFDEPVWSSTIEF